MGQRERAEEVGAELELEPIHGFVALRRCHHSRVVHERMQRLLVLDDLGSERSHRGEVGEIEAAHLDGSARSIAQDLSPRRLALLGRPDRQDNLGVREGQSAGGL